MSAMVEIALIDIFERHISSLPRASHNSAESNEPCGKNKRCNILIETKTTQNVRIIYAKTFDEESAEAISTYIEREDSAT
jgi:hypothetical protein